MRRVLPALVLAGALLPAVAQEPRRIASIAAGYGLVASSADAGDPGPSGALGSLSYGYVVGDRSYGITVLSLVAGYDSFPGDPTFSSLVYGAEYMHALFKSGPVSLLANYGLLFDLIWQDGRDGYAFGHHSRLQTGPAWWLDERRLLALTLDYNWVSFPYFETASGRISYASAGLRYFILF